MAKSDVKVEVGRLGAAARWGNQRSASSLVRIDADVANRLRALVNERDRRAVATNGVSRGIEAYLSRLG